MTDSHLLRMRQEWKDMIDREGFEVSPEDPGEQVCIGRTLNTGRRRGAPYHTPCGKPVEMAIGLNIPGQEAPIRLPLCRACLSKLIQTLVRYLE